jgi:hypothetical protein
VTAAALESAAAAEAARRQAAQAAAQAAAAEMAAAEAAAEALPCELHEAAAAGDAAEVTKLLEAGHDPTIAHIKHGFKVPCPRGPNEPIASDGFRVDCGRNQSDCPSLIASEASECV